MDNESSLTHDEMGTVLYIGHFETDNDVPITNELSSASKALGYDFLTTQITTPSFHSRVLTELQDYYHTRHQHAKSETIELPTISSLTPADTTLDPQNTSGSTIGIVSPWIDLGSADPVIAHISRQILNLEVSYAAFCGISNVVVYGPVSMTQCLQYARDIREALGLGPYLHLHVLLPMTGELEIDRGPLSHLSEMAVETEEYDDEEEREEVDSFASWDVWNTIRTVCDYSQKLSIALEIPRQAVSLNLQSRWYSEPVRILSFPRTSFLRNAKGFPVLSKVHQQLIFRFARLRFSPWMLLVDVDETAIANSRNTSALDPTPAEAASNTEEKWTDPVPHLRYFRHLQQTQPARPPIERFGHGYQDFLQSPLQPLTDNLESITYEVFERDPVKYEWYERAIAEALRDLSSVLAQSREVVVAVVGAGRGPLVTRALQASQETGIAIQCWAVEKNPNAYLLLQRRNQTDPLWNNKVHLVKSDMRHWTGPDYVESGNKVDILVSELLGSFADNELSPECLDGIQHVLHPEHGVNIPQSYSAHLTAISSPRLHSELLGRSGSDRWDLPYVVMLDQYDYLSARTDPGNIRTPEVKRAWSFSHPLPADILERTQRRIGGSLDGGGWSGGDGWNEHNIRSCSVVFRSTEPGVCHGLGGYFETVLYAGHSKTIELSTNPVTMEEKSKDMISWFPIFFPLRVPLYVPEGSDMHVSMWRQTDDRSVWYEWIVEVFESTEGRRRRLAISDLHSSRKNGCLI